jgi:CRP-like cAMP-binding protein
MNNSFTTPPSFSSIKSFNIFTPIEKKEIRKQQKPKTPKKLTKEGLIKSIKAYRKSRITFPEIISPNTLVNKLSFLYYENSKIKNYERIYAELLKLFETEHKQENEDDDINYNQLYKTNVIKKENNSNKDLENYYNINDYINLMKKPSYLRTMHDIYLIIHCLSKTKLSKSFQEDFSNNEIYGKLITFCSMEIKYKKYNKGQKIFNIGDLPDYFYIILNGKVDIIKPIKVKTFLTGNEYFLYLMNLLKNGDRYTYNLSIESNNFNFVIEKEDEKCLPYIYILINLFKKKTDLFFNTILSEANIHPEELGITKTEALDDIFVKKNIDKIKLFFPYKITADLIEKYYFIFDKYIKKSVYIYQNQNFLSLETNSHFGDSAMDGRTTRNATIVCSEDTDLGFLEMNLYHANISQEKVKLMHRKVQFFMSNFFFKRINVLTFQKSYFNYFITQNYVKGDVLFNENEKPEFVYFIEDGIVELSTSKSVIEMQMIIRILQEKRKSIENIFLQFRSEREHEMLYNNINNNCEDLLKYINKKEKHRIFILKNNESIGLISFFFNWPYITDCVIASNTAKIHKIDFKYLNQIVSSEKHCVYDLIKKVNYKIKLFQERFFNINNIRLSIADAKQTLNNKEKMELLRKETKKIERNKVVKNSKNKEKEDQAEVEKFQDIVLNFYNNKINNKLKLNHLSNLNNSHLPSIKTERILNKNHEKSHHFNLLSKILSRNHHKLKEKEKEKKNKSQLNLLHEPTIHFTNHFEIKNKKHSLIFENKETTKNNTSNNNNFAPLKHKFIQMEKKKIDKDAFLKYYKKYANNTGSLNSSLIFNKIKIKPKKKQKLNYESAKLNSNTYNLNISIKDEIITSRNYRLSGHYSNDNIFFSSQKIISNNPNEITNKNNNSKISNIKKVDKTTNSLFNELNNNYNEQSINSYTDRKMINKNINHPYYSPLVINKKQKYGIFVKNKYYNEKKMIGVKSKDLGFYHFSLSNADMRI